LHQWRAFIHGVSPAKPFPFWLFDPPAFCDAFIVSIPADVLKIDERIFQVRTKAPGPEGRLPLTREMLLERPSGDLFGLTQNVGMGWDPAEVGRKPFLILSTQGGMRAPDGKPIALGYHTGHWEIGSLVEAAARELRQLAHRPFRRLLLRPVRWPHPGNGGNVRQPPVSE
jgi:hypothetical protein